MKKNYFEKIRKIIIENVNFYETEEETRRIRFIRTFSVIGFVFFEFYGIYQLYIGSYIDGWAELMIGILFIVNVIAYNYIKKIELATNIVLLLVFSFYTLILITGGLANTGIYWFFIFPAIAFFIKGKKGGLRWMIYLYLYLITLLVLKNTYIIQLAFTSVQIIQMLLALFLLSTFVYVFQSVTEYSEVWISQRKKETEMTNKKLAIEAKIRKQAEKKAKEKLVEAEKLNQLMIGRELKIADLKNQLRKNNK